MRCDVVWNLMNCTLARALANVMINTMIVLHVDWLNSSPLCEYINVSLVWKTPELLALRLRSAGYCVVITVNLGAVTDSILL